MTEDFDEQRIFRKLQTFLAVRELYFQSGAPDVKAQCGEF
jgi:hypothetical protein